MAIQRHAIQEDPTAVPNLQAGEHYFIQNQTNRTIQVANVTGAAPMADAPAVKVAPLGKEYMDPVEGETWYVWGYGRGDYIVAEVSA